LLNQTFHEAIKKIIRFDKWKELEIKKFVLSVVSGSSPVVIHIMTIGGLVYIVVNFKTREISRDTRKLAGHSR
jgi:hypothetical protein